MQRDRWNPRIWLRDWLNKPAPCAVTVHASRYVRIETTRTANGLAISIHGAGAEGQNVEDMNIDGCQTALLDEGELSPGTDGERDE